MKKRGIWMLVFGLCVTSLFISFTSMATDLIYGRPSLGGVPLEPHGGGNSGRYQNLNLVYDTLVFADDDANLHPLLAKSWECSEDFREWTFYLREGVKFHNGKLLNAEAVKFSFDRILGIGTATVPEWRYLGRESEIQVIDDLTVRFVLPRPYPLFTTELVYACYAIVSPDEVKKYATDADPWAVEKFSYYGCGTGPFKFAEYIPGERLVLEKFDEYWGGVEGVKSAAKVDRLIMRIIPDATTRVILLQSGEVDIAEKIPVDSLAQLEGDPQIRVEYFPLIKDALLFINGSKPPFSNEKVRKAMAYAIDYDVIINVVERGRVLPMYGIVPKGMIGYDPKRFRYTRNLALARQLLEEAGYPDGFEATLIWASERRAEFDKEAVLIQEFLNEIGIKLTLQRLAYSAQLGKQKTGDFDLALMTFTAGTGDPSKIFDSYLPPDHPACTPQYSYRWVDSPEVVSEAIMYGVSIAEPEIRAKLYGFVDDLGMKHAVVIPLYQISIPFAIRQNVHGFLYDTLRRACFWKVWKD